MLLPLRLRYLASMNEESLKLRIHELAGDGAQHGNAVALLVALKGTVLSEIDPEDIEINQFTNAICFYWKAHGAWIDVSLEVYADRFETYLSRDRELRINHWPNEPQPSAIENVVEELLAGMG